MPLLSINEPGRCQLEGIEFAMLFGKYRVPCIVTYGYLSDMSGGGINPRECLQTFNLRRREIEHVASELSDTGHVTLGRIRVGAPTIAPTV